MINMTKNDPKIVRDLMATIEFMRVVCEHTKGATEKDQKRLTLATRVGISMNVKHSGALSDYQMPSFWNDVRQIPESLSLVNDKITSNTDEDEIIDPQHIADEVRELSKFADNLQPPDGAAGASKKKNNEPRNEISSQRASGKVFAGSPCSQLYSNRGICL
jgi:hypothetical protein